MEYKSAPPNSYQSYQPQQPSMASNVSYQHASQPQSQHQPQPQMMMPGVTVVNQTPLVANLTFPISFNHNAVAVVSILKCIIGFLQFVIGIVDAAALSYYWTSDVGFPIWCGILFIANGVIGCLTYKWPSTCLIASFSGLSITSLILSMLMLPVFSAALAYFVDPTWYTCDRYGYNCHYYRLISQKTQNVGTGLSSFMVFLICFELCLSIAAVVYSCKAYSKCCQTCDTEDCCTCVGCGECDFQTHPYTGYVNDQPVSSNQANGNQSRQQQQITSQQNQSSSPCSTLVNVIISFPGISHAINAASISTSSTEEPKTIQVTIQDNNQNQQASAASQEAASAPVMYQTEGATALSHMPQANLLGLGGEQEQAPPSYSAR